MMSRDGAPRAKEMVDAAMGRNLAQGWRSGPCGPRSPVPPGGGRTVSDQGAAPETPGTVCVGAGVAGVVVPWVGAAGAVAVVWTVVVLVGGSTNSPLLSTSD